MEGQKQNSLLFAKSYANLSELGSRFLTYRDLPQLIEQYVRGTKTLDYGCGSGNSTISLKSLGLEVNGVDICKHMIALAERDDPKGKYQVIASGEIPAEDDYYDFVYAGYVLPFVSSKSESHNIVKEIVRVLKPGGTFMAAVCNENTYKQKWLDIEVDFEENRNPVSGSIVKVKYRSYNNTTCHYYWSREDYYELFSASGLAVVYEHNPLGKDTEKFAWISETKVPIITMYVAKKPF